MATTSDGGDIAGSGTRPVKAANAAASKGGVKQVAIGGARDASKPSNVLHPGKQVIVIGGRGGGATDQETVMSSDQLQRALLQLVEKANSQPMGGPEGSGAAVKTMQQKNLSIPLIGQNEFNKFFFVPTSSSASASSSKQSGKGRPPSIKKSPHKLLKIPRKDKPGSASGSVRKPSNCTLPSNKTRLLMKTTPNVATLSQESVAVAGKAAELFIRKLAQDSYSISKNCNPVPQEITYTHLAQSVQQNSKQMKFLHDFVPHKVSAKDYITSSPPPHEKEEEEKK